MAGRFTGESSFLPKTSQNVIYSSTHTTSPDTKIKNESLENELFHLDLNVKDVALIVEQGFDFIDYPEILAKRLSIKVDLAKDALDELKAYKSRQVPKEEIKKFEMLVKENPIESPRQIGLLHGVHRDVVLAYLGYSEANPLTELEKVTIKEKYNAGFSITQIAVQLKLSEKKIREYVESSCINFNGIEGMRILDIIHKNFEEYPIMKLKEMILTKNVQLQEKIGCELPKRSEREYQDVKQYFLKFEESQNFFEIDETLSSEAKACIRASSLDDIGDLSLKLNKIERVIRDYLLRYSPDRELMFDCAQKQLSQIQNIKKLFGTEIQISHTIYRMIISDSFSNLIQNVNNLDGSPKEKFRELLPLIFYYIKCSLPLEQLRQTIASISNISLTTLDIFHLIFQMSDPVVRGLCIEHYSFSNPVPFYYPLLESNQPEQTCTQFKICNELWYSLQEFHGLVSFGLGWASWNPIGKSTLLDLMFETDFVKGSPQNSPFHLNSIDIQMTKNLFGDRSIHESTQWAYIDCNASSDSNVIGDICQNLDIALIHVSYSDYKENHSRLMDDLNKITVHTLHVYVLVRDCSGGDLSTQQMPLCGKTVTFIFIPNLIEQNLRIIKGFKKIGYSILHSKTASPRIVGNHFLEKLIGRYGNRENLEKEEKLIQCIKDYYYIQDSSKLNFSFLSYYPHFVEYMRNFYKSSIQTDQKAIDRLNSKCEQLSKHLEDAEMSALAWHFNDILAQENSTLILWKLSQELNLLSKQLTRASNKTPYTLEILWREALLSNKYNASNDKGKPASKYFEIFSSNFSNHVERGEPFELIDGDNLRFFNQDIDALLPELYEKQLCEIATLKQQKRPPIVVSIFGPQSSGKSTLLNYCFGCKFLTSAGRCTKGIYGSLSKLSQPVNNSEHFLILDTEGLDAIERGKNIQDTSCIHFDRTMVLFCLAVSQVVIINVKGDLGEGMRNLLQICAYSLNRLKVSKVSAPKIFFVLNQQADPDPGKHLNSINTLLEKLNEESYLMETEGLKISELIQVSRENLFVLPSAFNSEPLNTQMTKLLDSDLDKLSPTISFANKCADLRMAIIHQLKSDSCDSDSQSNFNDLKQDYKIPFKTMSEWMEMSGVIWDTIVKYQDIVKYRNTEELRCSISLNKILSNLMKQIIYFNKNKYRSITEKSIRKINDIANWSPPKGLLEEVKKELSEIFETYQEEALTIFAAQCQHDSLLKRMNYMCDEAKSNLSRLIYMEKKIYEDKLKFQLKTRLTEIKLKESMMKFQEDIEKNADKYFELTIEEQKREFNKVWRNCFRDNKYEEEEDELNQKFDDLYSLFRMESKTMENKQTIYALFRKFNFKMDKIIQDLREQILTNFHNGHQKSAKTEQFIYPWKENRVPIKEMTPYTGKTKCEYLNRTSLYNRCDVHSSKPNLKFSSWVPSECHPLVKYCSGYFNHPDVIWKLEKRKQIALLASHLIDPYDFKKSTWDKFINDISKSILEFTKKDSNISHSTVKEIVDFLCHICKVVNYEINFIEAKLTNVAERRISTYAFALAFKSLLKPKLEEEREIKSQKAKKEKDLKYFLQKVQNRELARGSWNRKEMRNGDLTMANKFAGDLLAAVWREVNTACEQNVNDRYFDAFRNKLSHKSLLLLANENVSKELNSYNYIDESNFVVEYICDYKRCLKTLFQEEWFKLTKELHDKIIGDMRDKFTEQIAKVELVLNEFLERLLAECKKLDRLEDIGSDSDSNFEVVDKAITEENTCNLNPKIRFAPFNAMVFFLEIYLNPKVSAEEFKNVFKGVFRVNDINIQRNNQTYVLFEKSHNPIRVLDEETFKMMSESNMFRSTETIFNIKFYVQEFLRTLNGYEYQVTEAEYENILKATKELFEADVLNCRYQCPSCGKFCEREIHPQGGRCRIMTGHQMCSMGGKVWNINEDRTAILLMCDDYMDGTQVLIPGQNLTWCEFKENCGDEWDWSLPRDENYVVLQRENRDKMKRIWNKFGREILNYYANKGTHITYVPYTSREEIYRSLFSLNYYICFVIDGTGLTSGSINTCVSQIIEDTLGETVYFKIVVYHGHAVSGQKCVEKFPNNHEFTTDAKSIQNFLERINTYGSEGNGLAMLHGLAAAATETDWKSGFGVKNVISHIYLELTNESFNIFTARGKCDQGCQFNWERDIRDKMDAFIIEYQPTVYINMSHPDYHLIKHYKEHSSTEDKPKRFKKLNPKAQIFINYKADN